MREFVAMLLMCVLFLTIIYLFYYYQTRNHGYWERIGVPCAKNLHWFFGNYTEVIKGKDHIGVMFQKIYNEFPQAPYVGFMKMNTPSLLVKDPNIIKSILTTDFNYFSKNAVFSIDKNNDFLSGHNPFVLEGEEWKMTRGHATPLSTISKLKTYFPNIIDVGNIMIDYIKSQRKESEPLELETKHLSGTYTTDVVANAFLGVSNNTFADPDSLFATLTREIFTGTRIDNIKFLLGVLFPKTAPYIGLRFSSKRCEEVLLSITRKIMKERTESGVIRNDVFQQMLTYRKNDPDGIITDEYVASHCFSFVADGYETSSDVICFTLFELAWNSDVQDKLRLEINEMLKETNGDYTVEIVESLKYLNMVISESLRLHPPGLGMMKLATKDYVLPKTENGKSIKIKKDTPVGIPLYGLHMDASYFPEPEKFDPERFNDENATQAFKYVYMPFGEGPRRCPGQRIGLLQVKVALLKIIENFRLKPSAKSEYPPQIDPQAIVNRPLNGAWVVFEEIKK